LLFFADDTAFYTSSRYAKTIIRKLEKTVRKFKTYFKKWKIKLNESKTQAIFFSNRRTKQIPTRPFKIGDSSINWESTAVKYLGVYLDKRLTFKLHVEYVIKKTSNAIKIIYSLLNRKSQLNIESKLLLYKVALRPIISYAAPIFSNIANTHKKKLQTIQNKILKMILNKPWHTSSAEIHEITKMETMNEHFTKLNENFSEQGSAH
jgi:hypothetical protein